MNRTDLIRAIATSTGNSIAGASSFVSAFIEVVTEQLQAGEEVNITDLGKLIIRERAARTARNPSTGKPVQVPASNQVVFKPASKLKEAVNTKKKKK